MKTKMISIIMYLINLALLSFIWIKPGLVYSTVECAFMGTYLLCAVIYVGTLFRKKKIRLNVVNAFLALLLAFLQYNKIINGFFIGNELSIMGASIGIFFVTFLEWPVRDIAEQWKVILKDAKQYEMEEAAERQEEKERLYFAGRYTKLFYLVMLKNFLRNWKDYALLLICNVVIFGFIVTGFGMQEILSGLSDYQGVGLFSGITTVLFNALIPMAIISVIIIIILFFYYLKCRARNNGVLLTLGMRRNGLYYFVALEFGSVLILSLILGSLLGTGILAVFAGYTKEMIGEAISLSMISGKTYFRAILVIGVLYTVSVMASRDIFTDFNVGRTTGLLAHREKIFRSGHLIFIILGAVVSVACLFLYSRSHNYENIYLVVGTFLGVLLLVLFGLAKFLIRERKTPSYLKKMLLHNQLFHKSRTNSAYIYALVLIQSCVLFYFSFQGISASIAEEVDKIYPYDIVCIADEEDEAFFEELQGKYEMEYQEYPMLRAVNYDSTEKKEKGLVTIQGQHIGISESIYHELKKKVDDTYEPKDLGLDADGEFVYIVYQQDESAKAKRIDYTISAKKPLLHVGVVCQGMDAFSVNRGLDVTYEYKKIAGEEINSLIGVFQQGLRENIIVFSDAYFEDAKDDWEETNILNGRRIKDESEKIPGVTIDQGPTKLILMNAEETVLEKIVEEISDEASVFTKNHAMDSKYDKSVSSYYTKADSKRALQTERIMKVAMNLLLMILFFFMNLMLIIIKILSERNLCVRRADFLKCMGMRRKDRIGYVKKEILYYFQILPAVISTILAGAFTAAVFLARQYTGEDIINYMKLILPVWAVYIVGSSMLVWIIATIYARGLEGEKYGSNS